MGIGYDAVMHEYKIVGKDRKSYKVVAATPEEAIAKAARRGIEAMGTPERIPDPTDDSWMEPDADERTARTLGIAPEPRPERYMYEVVEVKESAISNMMFGEARISSEKLAGVLNERARHGWRLAFQVERRQRVMLLWKRDVFMLTFERKV